MGDWGPQDAAAIREELQRILLSPGFVHSERLRRFLTHCVEATLQGRAEDLKEYVIGVTAFDRPTHYSPSEDPIVRVEARRLRNKLDEYYRTHGAKDPVVVQLPKGAYLPCFDIRRPALPQPQNYRVWIGAAALLLCAVGLGLWAGRRPAVSPELALSRVTSDTGLTTDPALLPDGSLLAYASDRGSSGDLDIWLQPLGSEPARLAPKRLTDDPADDRQPAISPDGKVVLFRSERTDPGIYRVPVAGGTASLVAKDGRNPRYSPDGQSVAYWIGSPGGDALPPAGAVYVMPSFGGPPLQAARDFASAACPAWSPDGNRLLIEGARLPGEGIDLWTVPRRGGPATATGIIPALKRAGLTLDLQDCSFFWSPDSVTLAASRGDTRNLWRLPVAADGRSTGLSRLTFGSAEEALPFALKGGEVAFTSRSVRLNVWRAAVDNPQELSPVTDGIAAAEFPDAHAIAGGATVAFLSKEDGRSVIWLQNTTTGARTPVARPAVDPRYPQVCPDGDTVAYNDGPNAYLANALTGQSRIACRGCSRVWQCSEAGLFHISSQPGGQLGIAAILPDGSQRTVLSNPRYDLAGARLSSDGWLAFHAITGEGKRQIFVAADSTPGNRAPIPPDRWIAISDGAHLDRNAVWNERADTLYFLSERCGFRCIWAQRVDAKTKKPVGQPEAVRHFHSARQGLSAIGDVGAIGLSYAAGYLYFALADQRGDIWLAKPAETVHGHTENR